MVFRALQRYPYYRHVAVCAHNSSWRAAIPFRIVRRAFVARELVIELRSRIWVQRGGGNVGDEVLVEAASLTGRRTYRGAGGAGGVARGAIAGEAGNRRPSSGCGETD